MRLNIVEVARTIFPADFFGVRYFVFKRIFPLFIWLLAEVGLECGLCARVRPGRLELRC